MKNILVPCDFSKPAEDAFRFAIDIAKQSGGEVHVLYVIDMTFLNGHPTLSNAYAFNVNFLKDIERESDEKFRVIWSRYAPFTMKVGFRHVISSLVPEVDKYIKEYNIDLVIMGTHGKGNAIVGSNADKVVRRSPVPVFSIRSYPKQIQKIILPVMQVKPDGKFVDVVKNLQEFFDAHLYIVSINTPLYFRNDPEAMRDLEKFASGVFSNYTLHIRSDYTVETGIANFTTEIEADLIAMGTHGWKGLLHLVVGSVAEDLINLLKTPVWTLHVK
ncbi:universal stress protein [Parachryseolinea silvisoli]|uniref:universal stress protein n=1 Tax=Parachryseolinea silvisoli TaxID=2873601 RepID=UPI002265CFA7|nr:universal stress protein [Parachryseolinea silvisoli]MCD9015103.1 universal stress protein [Parachryseolinea silvisoli]